MAMMERYLSRDLNQLVLAMAPAFDARPMAPQSLQELLQTDPGAPMPIWEGASLPVKYWAGSVRMWRSPSGQRHAVAFIPDGCGDYHRRAVNCASYYDPMVGAWYSERLDPMRAHAIVAEGSMSLQLSKAPAWDMQLREAGYIVERAI